MGHLIREKRAARFGAMPISGLITAIDPRVRVACAVAFSGVMVGLSTLPVLLAGFVFSGLLLCMAGLPVGRTLRRMLAMDGFMIVALLTLPFTTTGETAFTLWGWDASAEGLHIAAEIMLTANAVILALMALVGSMEPVTLGHALKHLRVPEGFVHLMLFSIRYTDVLRDEYRRLRLAMRARGFRARNTLHTYRSYGYLVGMMLVRAMERSERILDAMKCRGFTGTFPLLDDMQITPRDIRFAVCFAAALLLLAGLEVGNAVA